MRDRLSYAAIGLVFGLFLAAILWWLYGLGLSHRMGTATAQPDLLKWLKYVGGGCAVAGFVLKERIGDLVGGAVHAVYDVEARTETHVPTWFVVVFLAGVVATVWYFAP